MSKDSLNPKLQNTPLDNFDPVADVQKLQIVDIKDGDGQECGDNDTIRAHYTGAVCATGNIFESSKDGGKPAQFGLFQVIEGWQAGVPGMKEGGTRRLIIPAEMAYGSSSPSSDIPANSALVFDIELVKIID